MKQVTHKIFVSIYCYEFSVASLSVFINYSLIYHDGLSGSFFMQITMPYCPKQGTSLKSTTWSGKGYSSFTSQQVQLNMERRHVIFVLCLQESLLVFFLVVFIVSIPGLTGRPAGKIGYPSSLSAGVTTRSYAQYHSRAG